MRIVKSRAFPSPSEKNLFQYLIWNKLFYNAIKRFLKGSNLSMSAAKMMMKWDGWSNKKTYETIVFIWSFFVTFENAVYSWCDYHYTKSLKLLVIWCPGGKLIKWNDMKILTMTIQSFQYRKIFSWLNFDPFRKSIKINPFYEFVCPSYYFRAVKKIHDFFNSSSKMFLVVSIYKIKIKNQRIFLPQKCFIDIYWKSKITRKIENKT